jgi:uncharacterized protein YjbJ (UPF0337 family)
MKSSMRDKAEGKFHQMKGNIKQVAGKLSDNPKLEAAGTVEKISGEVQEKIGHFKKVFEQEYEQRVTPRLFLHDTAQTVLRKALGGGEKEFRKQQ